MWQVCAISVQFSRDLCDRLHGWFKDPIQAGAALTDADIVVLSKGIWFPSQSVRFSLALCEAKSRGNTGVVQWVDREGAWDLVKSVQV